jgi:hypothetical protein
MGIISRNLCVGLFFNDIFGGGECELTYLLVCCVIW